MELYWSGWLFQGFWRSLLVCKSFCHVYYIFIPSLLSLLFLFISMFWKQSGSVGLQDYPPWILLNFVANSIYSLRKIPFCSHSTDTLIMLGNSFNILLISLTHFIFIRWGSPLPILLLLLQKKMISIYMKWKHLWKKESKKNKIMVKSEDCPQQVRWNRPSKRLTKPAKDQTNKKSN